MKYQMTDLNVCMSLKKLGALCNHAEMGKELKNYLWQCSHSLSGFLLCTHTEVVNGLDCKSIVREFESHYVLIKQMEEEI